MRYDSQYEHLAIVVQLKVKATGSKSLEVKANSVQLQDNYEEVEMEIDSSEESNSEYHGAVLCIMYMIYCLIAINCSEELSPYHARI